VDIGSGSGVGYRPRRQRWCRVESFVLEVRDQATDPASGSAALRRVLVIEVHMISGCCVADVTMLLKLGVHVWRGRPVHAVAGPAEGTAMVGGRLLVLVLVLVKMLLLLLLLLLIVVVVLLLLLGGDSSGG
jgi:hypothetical protein